MTKVFMVDRTKSVVYMGNMMDSTRYQDGAQGVTKDGQGCDTTLSSGQKVLSPSYKNMPDPSRIARKVLRWYYGHPIATTDSLHYQRISKIITDGHECFEQFKISEASSGLPRFVKVSLWYI